MIVQDAADYLVLIRQTDHAVLSGFLAREWGNSKFSRPELFETFCFAVREHDNGWTEWEAAPQLDPKTRLPYSFLSMPMEDRTAIHQRGIDRVAKIDRYAGLLVSMHYLAIYEWMRATVPVFSATNTQSKDARLLGEYVDQLKLRQIRLRSEMRANPATGALVQEPLLKRRTKLVEFLDRLSLFLCMNTQEPMTVKSVPLDDSGAETDTEFRRESPDSVSIDPYPFGREPLAVSILGRRVPKRVYGNADDFQRTLAESPYFAINFRLCAAKGAVSNQTQSAVA